MNTRMRRALVTGGAGFIGSALVRRLVASGAWQVTTFDKLTYAGNLESLPGVLDAPQHRFVQGDVADEVAVRRVLAESQPEVIFHLAAESHVDRSIDGPREFLQTNVVGTFTLLTEALRYHQALEGAARACFRFLHVSTDEVFGSLGDTGHFTEQTPYAPSSPYSATKAASDHLVRAWHHTYGLPVLLTNCSNNYGPYQFPEKLIPHMIVRALRGETLPVYGTGANVRDWLHVDDHASALECVATAGRVGETYLVSGHNEARNLDLVHALCSHLDVLRPRADGQSYAAQITFVTDRPGHDFRYAIDASKLTRELGWQPAHTLTDGLAATVQWYLEHERWWQRILSGAYRADRIGLARAA
ncbi:MAG: dTDP-glucose 4,6-dehydratase [Gemmatimonadaceae bacterium]|jgi:dTDP-glucose 4,6-dehydratase|nr:dTDP-glucose 4,6-dehydratase [Gemmatimonadaceae bacterium]